VCLVLRFVVFQSLLQTDILMETSASKTLSSPLTDSTLLLANPSCWSYKRQNIEPHHMVIARVNYLFHFGKKCVPVSCITYTLLHHGLQLRILAQLLCRRKRSALTLIPNRQHSTIIVTLQQHCPTNNIHGASDSPESTTATRFLSWFHRPP